MVEPHNVPKYAVYAAASDCRYISLGVCSEYHQEIDDTDDRCIIEIDDTDERCIIDLELLRYCKMMSEDGENIYCVPYTSLDLTLITSVNYFDTGSSSVALARVYYCAILRNTAAVITSTFGSHVRTVGITTMEL